MVVAGVAAPHGPAGVGVDVAVVGVEGPSGGFGPEVHGGPGASFGGPLPPTGEGGQDMGGASLVAGFRGGGDDVGVEAAGDGAEVTGFPVVAECGEPAFADGGPRGLLRWSPLVGVGFENGTDFGFEFGVDAFLRDVAWGAAGSVPAELFPDPGGGPAVRHEGGDHPLGEGSVDHGRFDSFRVGVGSNCLCCCGDTFSGAAGDASAVAVVEALHGGAV